ncbi:MAG: hypothetical protein M0Z41_18610 [Peptococcaceae bacterium]|nr:hypothetical protein [Peptococcaceae bacterium]
MAGETAAVLSGGDHLVVNWLLTAPAGRRYNDLDEGHEERTVKVNVPLRKAMKAGVPAEERATARDGFF